MKLHEWRFLLVYALLMGVAIGLASRCLSVSMAEPYRVVTIGELTWQLIIPSSLLTLALGGGAVLTYALALRRIRIRYALPLALGTLFVALVATEAIYGYLWDLRVHAGIR